MRGMSREAALDRPFPAAPAIVLIKNLLALAGYLAIALQDGNVRGCVIQGSRWCRRTEVIAPIAIYLVDAIDDLDISVGVEILGIRLKIKERISVIGPVFIDVDIKSFVGMGQSEGASQHLIVSGVKRGCVVIIVGGEVIAIENKIGEEE